MRRTAVTTIGAVALLAASASAERVWQLPIGLDGSAGSTSSLGLALQGIALDPIDGGARLNPSDASVPAAAAHGPGAPMVPHPDQGPGGVDPSNLFEFDDTVVTLALGLIPAPMPSNGPGSFGSNQATPTRSGTSDTHWTVIGPLYPGLGGTIGNEDAGAPRLVEVTPVPLPTPMMLAGCGLLAMAGVRASARRRA